MEKIFQIIRKLILDNYKIQDTQCGFKVMKREAALKIFPFMTVERFAFDAEIIFLATKYGCKIKELPITLQNPIRSHIRIFRDSFNMFFDLIRIRFNDIRGSYNQKA